MNQEKRHSNTAKTSKAIKRQSGTFCLNTRTSKKAVQSLSNSTVQAEITSKKESMLAGTTATTERTSKRKEQNKRNLEKNSLKGKSTKNSSGKDTKRNADATSKEKSVKKGSKKPCNHSYELSVPYEKAGKVSVATYYKNQPKKHVCHWKCTKCNDRTITWSTDQKKYE